MIEPGDFPGDLQPDARRFASLTKLQYERFKIWKDDDDFHLKDDAKLKSPKCKLEDIDLEKQPGEFTRAILESTTGDPLYPGIEMSWISKLETTVGFGSWCYPFPSHIDNDVLHSMTLPCRLILPSE